MYLSNNIQLFTLEAEFMSQPKVIASSGVVKWLIFGSLIELIRFYHKNSTYFYDAQAILNLKVSYICHSHTYK